MEHASILRVYLEPQMLASARSGSFNFLNILSQAVTDAGWRLEWMQTSVAQRLKAPLRRGYALYHTEAPTHDRALTFRRAYHYPFWNIEQYQQRWRFHTAQVDFQPDQIDPAQAQHFVQRLRERVLPGPAPRKGDHILVPLQGHIRSCRSFQSASPVEMLAHTARTGRPVIATLHPNEHYSDDDRLALAHLAEEYPNLTIGGDTMAALRDCAFVVAENSAVAFHGYILGKPAVLFAQIDFHHIALNAVDLGPAEALRQAPDHHPDFARYLFWFLRVMAIQAAEPDAKEQVLAAMRRCGWPI